MANRAAICVKIQTPVLWALVAVVSGALAIRGAQGADKPGAKSTSRSKASTHAKPDASGAVGDESDADDGSDVDVDLSALVLPAQLLGSIRKSDELRFSLALRGLLLEGMTADGASSSKRHFDVAHQSIPGDPRPSYVYGLALLVQKNPKEALSQFRTLARSTKFVYLPALQALAWVHLVGNDYDQGLTALSDLAHKIAESRGDWPTEHDKVHSAEWIGRMIGYLAGPGLSNPGNSANHGAQVKEAVATIEKCFSGDQKAAFEHGQRAMARRHDELKALAARPVDEVLEEFRQKRDETRSAAQTAAASVKTIEEEIRALKKPFDQQITEADREIRTHSTKAKKSAHDLPALEDEVQALSVPRQYPLTRTRYGRQYVYGTRNESAQETKTRTTALASAEQQLQQLRTEIDNAKQSVTEARTERDKARADLRKALADKRTELIEAQRASHELAARAKDAERAIQTPESLKLRVTALDAYVPLDVETEKTRLLATLKASKTN